MRTPRLRDVVAVFVFGVFVILAVFLLLLGQANRTISRQSAAVTALSKQVSELSACILAGDSGSARCRKLATQPPPVIRVESGGETRIVVPGSANSSSRSSSGSSSPRRTPSRTSAPRSTPAPKRTPQPTKTPKPQTCVPRTSVCVDAP